MFGYVHISPDKLSGEERARYQACYCGLCHTLGERYGACARMILSYDLVFLAVLLSDGQRPVCAARRCALHPLHPRCACQTTQALETADSDVWRLAIWILSQALAIRQQAFQYAMSSVYSNRSS